MERINEILKKYFEGTSSLSEEKELKTYFNGQNIAEEHEVYKAVFQNFVSEKSEQTPQITPIKAIEKPKRTFKRNIFLTISGIAATLLLMITTARSQTLSEDYVISNGKRINNSEMAQKLAEEKLSKSFSIINQSMEPMDNLGKIEKKLEKVNKVSNIKDNNKNKTLK
ncbi:MAG: hypothetical protein H6Q18_97 [Bacteroidetes bacterium]|nr:hypothetical protein [Bacteroidota bacterium]